MQITERLIEVETLESIYLILKLFIIY